jgi:hypothetical protein
MSAKGKKNVQAQVAMRKRTIAETALKHLQAPVRGVIQLLEAKDMAFPSGVLVSLTAYPACCEHIYTGIVVSRSDRFFQFVVELSQDESEVLNLEEWIDITNETEISNHKRGIGRTFGALALEVRNEILLPKRHDEIV